MVIEFSCAAVCVFLILAFPAANHRLWLLPIAFVLSYIGDLFLRRRTTDTQFIYGILFFFSAHVCFFVYALAEISKYKLSWPVLAAVTIPYLVFYFTVLQRSAQLTGNPFLAAAVLLYLLISCFSFAASVDPKRGLSVSWIFTAGILCLLISDTIIALASFLRYRRFYFLMMPLFYTSHILIVISVTLKNVLFRK